MERKAKTGISAFLIIGIVFTLIGAVFLLVGIISYILKTDMQIFSLTFGGTGLAFFVIGAVFLAMEIRKKILSNRLFRSGNYILAEISEVRMNYSIQVVGRHPFVVICQYQDRYGNVHMFKSRNLYFNPSALFKDQKVKIYVEGEKFRHYYVDIDEVLPKVIEH